MFSLGRWSSRIRAGLHVSDLTQEHLAVCQHFDYGAITVYGRPFQVVRLCIHNRFMRVLQPPRASSQVWAVAFSLATTKAISRFDFFSPVTEMFQFTEYTFLLAQDLGPFRPRSYLIRKSSAGSACLAADRSISQLATSFIGVESRGIHSMR